MLKRLKLIFTDKELRGKFLLVILLAIIARLALFIPMPFVQTGDYLKAINNQSGDQFTQLLNSIIGSGYGTLSIAMLGIGPYITASIAIQLATSIVPALQRLQAEGGQESQLKINQYTRFLAFALGIFNGYFVIESLVGGSLSGVNPFAHIPALATNVASFETIGMKLLLSVMLSCGSIFVMWLTEIISETKIVSGASLVIFLSSLSSFSRYLFDVFKNAGVAFKDFKFTDIFTLDLYKNYIYDSNYEPVRALMLYIIITVITALSIVFVYEGIKNVPLLYIRRGHRSDSTRSLPFLRSYLPIRVLGSGLMCIILAGGIVALPLGLFSFTRTSNSPVIKNIASDFRCFSSNDQINTNDTKIDKEDRAKCYGLDTAAELETYTTQQLETFNGVPKNKYANFFVSGKAEELQNASFLNTTEGQELFAFSFSTFKGENANTFPNQIQTGLRVGDFKLDTPKFGINPGFLPEFGIRFNGILGYFIIFFLLILFFNYFFSHYI